MNFGLQLDNHKVTVAAERGHILLNPSLVGACSKAVFQVEHSRDHGTSRPDSAIIVSRTGPCNTSGKYKDYSPTTC